MSNIEHCSINDCIHNNTGQCESVSIRIGRNSRGGCGVCTIMKQRSTKAYATIYRLKELEHPRQYLDSDIHFNECETIYKVPLKELLPGDTSIIIEQLIQTIQSWKGPAVKIESGLILSVADVGSYMLLLTDPALYTYNPIILPAWPDLCAVPVTIVT